MNLLTLPQDRDYTPYAYPAIFRTGYLEDGHVDIKPPLIHWAYKLWISSLNICGLSRLITLQAQLRILPLLGMIFSVLCLSISGHIQGAVVLALLFVSPTLWPHMANTEWLTVTLMASCCILPAPLQWIVLGLLPWANQKNVFLVLLLAWALHLPLSWDCLYLCVPSVIILSYLYATDRLEDFLHWCWFVPATFGVDRTFKRNTLSAARLLIPCVALLAPFIAVMGVDRWAALALVVFLVMVWSKQVVPHHFLLVAFPVAMSAAPVALTWVAFLCVWIPRDGICWWNPAITYKFVFSGNGGDYGSMMADLAKIEKWIRENTPANAVIWVNGIENQVYVNALRKAWRIEIPELKGLPEGDAPRWIVHCVSGSKKFDYTGYEAEVISTSGNFSLMVKR